MNTMPAREFVKNYTNAYGMTWEELFSNLVGKPACAKHMAEFIDDVEMYGQQTVAYVDKDGMVDDGNRMAIALCILDQDINYENSESPVPQPHQLWTLEFDVDSGDFEHLFEHLDNFVSYRVGADWVYPLSMGGYEDSIEVLMYCEGGENTANGIAATVQERLENKAGVSVSGIRVARYECVDEDVAEW